MRLLECASLLSLTVALIALTFRISTAARRRALFGVVGLLMGLQAVIEGARWQLGPAYVLAIIGAALSLRADAPRAARRKILRALGTGLAAIVLLFAVSLPALVPMPSFPAPEGPYPVGTVTFVLEDPARADEVEPGRHRRLMAQAWYPADASAASMPAAPYMADVKRIGPGMTRAFGVPSFFLSHLAYARSHSHEGAPFSPSIGRAPLLIMSHGFRVTRTMSTTTAEALASRGYVVIGLDHTHDAAAVAFPDGSVVLTSVRPPKEMSEEEEVAAKTASILVRAADVRFVLDTALRASSPQIPEVLAGHIDATKVGVFGHSLGGGTAVEVCRSDARVAACANLDGQIYGEAKAAGLSSPFLHVENEGRGDISDGFIAKLRGPSCRVRGMRVAHLDFCEIPLLFPISSMPKPGRKKADSGETLRATNDLLVAFFDATVRGEKPAWSRVKDARPPFLATCERLPVP